MKTPIICVAIVALLVGSTASAQDRYDTVASYVNPRMVKVFGSGGYRGLVAYGTGVIVSADGFVLTAGGSLLDTQELRVHLNDGRRCLAKVVVIEPALDAALIKIEGVENLQYFDIASSAARPVAKPGEWVFGFSNAFEIATRDEPMSIQRGVISAYTRLPLQRGIFDAPYHGDVYVVDAITNNPGAAGGALVNRIGELLGIIGKELRNALADTWVNYAVPVQAKIEARNGENVRTVSLLDFVQLGIKGAYQPTAEQNRNKGDGAYHGIVLVPNVVERTPPYIEEVTPESPAAKAGLQPDDLIVYIDGVPISSIVTFRQIMGATRSGQVVKLEVRRGEKLVPVEMKLVERPK
jgi:serine protease Do